jgi:hypothetical protein
VTLVAIAREEFESLLGHLRDLLERNLGMRLLLCIPIVSLLSNEEVRGSMMLDFMPHITLRFPQHRSMIIVCRPGLCLVRHVSPFPLYLHPCVPCLRSGPRCCPNWC